MLYLPVVGRKADPRDMKRDLLYVFTILRWRSNQPCHNFFATNNTLKGKRVAINKLFPSLSESFEIVRIDNHDICLFVTNERPSFESLPYRVGICRPTKHLLGASVTLVSPLREALRLAEQLY